MTGFKDRLKDALSDFVEFDENALPPDGSHPAPAPRPASVPDVAVAATPAMGAVLADPEMLSTLEHAVARSTTPGFDQFRTLYAAMEGVPDEALRYDVALKALRASHQLGPDDVLASIEDRIRLLEVERSKFEQALAAETDRSVEGTNRQIRSVAETIATKQAEIRDLEARQATLHASAKTSQETLDRSRAAFGTAFASVHGSLDAERTRIASHLSRGK